MRPVGAQDGNATGPVGKQDAVRLAGVLEAAKVLGLTPDGVRARIRRGILPARKGNDGQWRVELSAAVLARQDDGQDGRQDGHDAGAVDRQDELARRLAWLEQAFDGWRREAEAAQEARLARVRAEAELEAARRQRDAEIATRNAVIETLRESLAKSEARIDRLEAQLAEARKPTLVRLLEAFRRGRQM